MSLLNVKELNKIYNTGKVEFQALYDINLLIGRGEFVSLCGPSGSGKTTLLNAIGCIDTFESGDILLEENSIKDKTSNELAFLRREYFGFIFQTYNLIPVLTVFENVELPLKLLGKSEKECKDAVLEILERVGLKGLEYRMPDELSGGQKQRVSIARALVKKPKIVLADEPTANLDSATGDAIVMLMKEMNKKDGITFIFSTHDSLIMKYAKRKIILHDGKIEKDLIQ